jgi:prepilin-type N-terminal cleavage/methylation domain-containing protein
MLKSPRQNLGFTLVELSIVLVIIGLIIGGVLVGRDLISAATVRAQISQIEKYNTAVNTFRGKYGELPGDMSVPTATQMGFVVGSGCTGEQGGRDGNGLIDGYAAPFIHSQGEGETALFWQDLSAANLINDSFATSSGCGGCPVVLPTSMGIFFPTAKIGNGNYVYVYENNGQNYFGIMGAGNGIETCGSPQWSTFAIPVLDAYSIDAKIDDGFPETGNVQAKTVDQTTVGWAYTTWGPDPLECFDSNPTYFPNTSAYSINTAFGNNSNNSDIANCALSFQFQ